MSRIWWEIIVKRDHDTVVHLMDFDNLESLLNDTKAKLITEGYIKNDTRT